MWPLFVGAEKTQSPSNAPPPQTQDRNSASGEWNSPACAPGFSMGDLDHVALNVLPPQAETFFGANPAVRQEGRNVAEQEGITWFDRNLTALGRSYSR
jgi:hypothetical protein